MTFKKQTPDKFGNDYSDSHWTISDINFSIESKTIIVKFAAYKDKLARGGQKLPIPGAEKSYTISGDVFDKVYNTLFSIFGPYFYQFAREEKDISTPENGPDGKPIYISFFEDALDEDDVEITQKLAEGIEKIK